MSAAVREVDVLIVGGGPAGSSVAWGLRGSGLRIEVMDKQPFPRNKICAGWITPAVVAALELDLDHYARGRVLQPITGFRVGVIGGHETRISPRNDSEPLSYGIRRCEFDAYLLARSGAGTALGEACSSVTPVGDGWLINQRILARVLVGAGGHFCPIARALGARLGHREVIVAAQELEVRLSSDQQQRCGISGESPAIYFCVDLVGYGWAFRKGDWLNIGIGREDNRNLAEHLQQFHHWLVETGRIPDDLPARFAGHAYLLANHTTRTLTNERALLVGDAAGLAYPQSGEGIRPAVESGLIAAQILRDSGGEFGAQQAADYSARIGDRFGARQDLPVRRRPSLLKAFLGRSLLKARWFNRSVVVDRWFLHRHVPALQSRTR